MNSARNRELLALVPASLLLTAGFAAVFIERNDAQDLVRQLETGELAPR